MFEATIDQGDVFKNIITAIGDLVQEANLEVDNEGIRLQAMDSSHVSLVSLWLAKESAFSHYKCEKSVRLGINFASLNKVLKLSKKGDSVTLRVDDDDSADTMALIFTDKDETRTLHFDLKLMEIDSERLVIPDTDYICTVRMSSKEFKALCTDLHSIGESVNIACNKEAVKFELTGDIGQGSVTYKHNADMQDIDDMDSNANAVLIRAEEALAQNFALRYLQNFTKATILTKVVDLFMSPEVPLVAEYKIDDMGHIKYYLAPKIDDED